ncbi:MAG: hypothetical protein M3294_06975 [Pseudomonadota bacterium]|nr:hypothetical protein [Pseudomonadota bacterium]
MRHERPHRSDQRLRLRTPYQEGMAGLPSEAGGKAEAVRAGLQAKQDKRSAAGAAVQALGWPLFVRS